MMPFTEDFTYFFATIYGGVIIGLLFDFYRASKRNSKIMQRCSLVLDVLFWIIATLIIFITINAIESFELRYYHFVALFIGFILYYNTISTFILTIINKIIFFVTSLFKKTIQYIVSISENLYYVITYSLHLLFDIIFYIPNMILATSRFIKRKTVRKLKIRKRV